MKLEQKRSRNSFFASFACFAGKPGLLLPGLVAALLTTGCFGGHARRQERASNFLDDKVTAARVQGVLGTNFPAVHVTVNGGVARLSGSVQTPQQKERVTALARSVERVKGVENDLSVQGK